MTHAGGRPSLYKPEYSEQVVVLAKEGKSFAQIAAHFDVARSTIDQWGVDNQEFSEAIARAKAHMQAWWENDAQQSLKVQGYNSQVWKKTVEARFREDYTERQEFSGPNGGAIPIQTEGPSARELAKAMALTLAKGLKEAGEE